ncbi:MAG: helix-turn-helix transcriptional regulator, partial [Rhodocyclaceae bacterium]|nr:helix-turn-helix transcriptional regulator [Rhodocyclaceae bacterium]
MRRYVGERIKKLREAQDMSLEQVCRMTGISADRLKAYEEGTAVPPIGTVIQLSRVLGSKMEGLLHGGGTVSETLTICRAGESLAGEQGDTEQSYAYSSLTRP